MKFCAWVGTLDRIAYYVQTAEVPKVAARRVEQVTAKIKSKPIYGYNPVLCCCILSSISLA